MPKISDEQWEQRRQQILEAAWRCFHRKGVQPTTMEDIIAESQMAASAMYRYFRGKDDIILSAIAASLGALAARLGPLLEGGEGATPPEFVAEVLATIEQFSARDDYNLLPIAIHGWSEAQRDEHVRELLRGFYQRFRAQLERRALHWQQAGLIGPQAPALEIAQALQSLLLGYIVQATIVRDVTPAGHARAVAAMLQLGFDEPGAPASPAAKRRGG